MPDHAGFADHFSAAAGGYARFRPRSPPALLAWLAARAPARRRAWDCATGSGQAAVALVEHVALVVATDASAAQLAAAERHPRVAYARAAAEACPLADASVELVTVAQALHWFDLPAFYAEARRVLVPGGVLAAWTYGLATIDAAVDAVVRTLYTDVLGPHWPAERALVEHGYAGVPFPFAELAPPPFTMEHRWTLAELLGYLGTWSATQAYRRAHDADPLSLVRAALARAWGDPTRARTVRWPMAVRVGVASEE